MCVCVCVCACMYVCMYGVNNRLERIDILLFADLLHFVVLCKKRDLKLTRMGNGHVLRCN